MRPVGFPYNYSLCEHLRERLLRHSPRWGFFVGDSAQVPAWRTGLTGALRDLLGIGPEPVGPPDARLLGEEEILGGVMLRLAIQVAQDLAVPCYLLTPADKDDPAPSVLALGVRQGGKISLAKELLALLATGVRVLIPDLPGQGERLDDTSSLRATLLSMGDSLPGWVVRESLAFLVYLRSLPEAPPGQVGLVGLGSAVVPALLAAALDPAVKAVALGGDLRSEVERLLESNCLEAMGAWETEWFPPGLLRLAELSDLAALLAPRPLLLVDFDPDEKGQSRTLRLAEQAYAEQGCAPRLETHTGCDDTPDFVELAAEFMSVWLPAELSDLPG